MHCLVCDSSDLRPWYRPQRSPGPVVQCGECSFVFVYPVEDASALIDDGPALGDRDPGLLTSSDLDDLEVCWERDLLESKELQWPSIRIDARNALERIEAYVRPPGKLLDFGCGWGFFLAEAIERGWEASGLEPLPGTAIHARSRFGADVITATLKTHTFPPETFDAITAFQVFEHLPDPAGDLRKLIDSLRPGGVILVEVPNIDTIGVRLLKKRHRHFVEDHLHFFSIATLSRLMEVSGLEVVDGYHTTRHLTIEHLTTHWGRKVLPTRVQSQIVKVPAARSNRVIPLNLHDIITVIGRKPS